MALRRLVVEVLDFCTQYRNELLKLVFYFIINGFSLVKIDTSAVDFHDGCQFSHGAGSEHSLGSIKFGETEILLGTGEAQILATLDREFARDPRQTGVRMWRKDLFVPDEENICAI